MTYNFFGPEENFNPHEPYHSLEEVQTWDFGTKSLGIDIGIIPAYSSQTTLKLRKTHPK